MAREHFLVMNFYGKSSNHNSISTSHPSRGLAGPLRGPHRGRYRAQLSLRRAGRQGWLAGSGFGFGFGFGLLLPWLVRISAGFRLDFWLLAEISA